MSKRILRPDLFCAFCAFLRQLLSGLVRSTLVVCSTLGVSASADVLIENVAIVSPELSRATAPRNVLIRDGRIASISDKPIAANNAQRVNGRGKFLAPGVMDSHVHVADAVGLPFASDDLDIAALRAAYFKQQPRSYLYFGVTQVLDTNSSPQFSEPFVSAPQHPDFFWCGGAPVLNGYPTALINPSVRYKIMPNWIYEPANSEQHPLPAGFDAKEHTPEAVVERIAASGARCVKAFVEDGFGDRSVWPLLSEDSLKRLRIAAQAKGLLVLVHANALSHQQRALAGTDVLAHGLWHWEKSNTTEGVPERVASHLRNIDQRKIGYQPTLRVIFGEADLFRSDTLEDPMYAKVVPAALLAWYGTAEGQWYKREMKSDFGGDVPDSKIVQMELQVGSRNLRAAKYLHDLGHPLLLASDTPSGPIYGNQPGYDTYREMRAMAQAGIPLDAIFRAATINNAKQFGIERDYGTVQVGKIANVLLLNLNPLETVRAWSAIDKIVLRGEVIERESLEADRN